MARVSVPSVAGSQFGKTATVIAVSCLIGALFAGSTVATPLYVIYKQQLGFSQITLTLIYAVYVVGNLTALMILRRRKPDGTHDLRPDVRSGRPAALSSRAAMLWSIGLMLPSLALLVTAQFAESLGVMIAATAICGVAAGLGYRGSLQVVNQIAPDDRRAEVVSAYFICCFLGNALPVIGIGVLATLISSTVASLVFAVTIAMFALVALVFGLKYQAG
ncbi:MFS transporter [Bradyrhizobium sp. USDA 4449]